MKGIASDLKKACRLSSDGALTCLSPRPRRQEASRPIPVRPGAAGYALAGTTEGFPVWDRVLRSGGTEDRSNRPRATDARQSGRAPIGIPPGAIIISGGGPCPRPRLSLPLAAPFDGMRGCARGPSPPRGARVCSAAQSWDSAICRPASRCRFSVRGHFYFQPNAVPSSTCRPPASWPSR